MASAAAVAADQALSPDLKALDFEQTENGGTVTSSILPPDEKAPDNLHELHEDDDDEDIVVRSRPCGPQMNGAPEGEEEEELGDDDDLFGDGDDADDEPYVFHEHAEAQHGRLTVLSGRNNAHWTMKI